MSRTYSGMMQFETFRERFEYLKLDHWQGYAEFGHRRYLNQALYACPEWKAIRNEVIARDLGRDLGCEGYDIHDMVIVHHIDPITVDDILNRHPKVFDLNNLICVSDRTHKAVHYGNANLLPETPITRRANDTCPWLA